MNERIFGVQPGCLVPFGGICSKLTTDQEAIWQKVDSKFNDVSNE